MIKIYLVISILSTVFVFGVSFVTLIDLNAAILVGCVFLVYFLTVGLISVKKYEEKKNKIHEEYKFINSFIVAFSVKSSIDSAFETACLDASNSLKELIKRIDSNNSYQKIKYLQNYFENDIYKLFIKVIDSYLENGGDILNHSKILIEELTRIENLQIEYDRTSTSKIFEFIILWFLSLLIVVVMRFALKDFYLQIMMNPLFKVGLFIFYDFIVVSIHLMISSYTSFLKGESYA